MKKVFYILITLICTGFATFAQDQPLQGIVFDMDTKQRLTRVYIYNLRTGEGFYNNTKGEFKNTARDGDVLVAALQGYGVDTVKVKAETVLFYLRRNSIQLQEVVVKDSVRTPAEQLKATQEEYNTAYTKGAVKDVFKVGGSNGGGGAGLGIDALYSLLSREGKNARMLQKIIERDYREAMIDYRYTATLINNVTGLSGDKLRDFRQQYRPGYYFILEASDYDLIRFIQRSYVAYSENPAANRLPALKGSAP